MLIQQSFSRMRFVCLYGFQPGVEFFFRNCLYSRQHFGMTDPAILCTEHIIRSGFFGYEPGIRFHAWHTVSFNPERRHIKTVQYVIGDQLHLDRFTYRYIQFVARLAILIGKEPRPHAGIGLYWYRVIRNPSQ